MKEVFKKSIYVKLYEKRDELQRRGIFNQLAYLELDYEEWLELHDSYPVDSLTYDEQGYLKLFGMRLVLSMPKR